MAKKITGQSKLLQRHIENTPTEEPLNLIKPHRAKAILKNYRFSSLDLDNLQKITEALNQEYPHQTISETKIVRSLILLGSQMKPERILKALKELL